MAKQQHAASSSSSQAALENETTESITPVAEEMPPAVSPGAPPTPPPPPDPPVTPSAGSQYEIIYEVRSEEGVKEVGVNVTATSEAEAFDLASKAVEAIGNEDRPITWRYTGRFRKFAA